MQKNNQENMDMISLLQNTLQKEAEKLLKENEKKAEKAKTEAELERQKYRATLKPVSKEEFMKRFAELSKKNDEWEKYANDKGVLFVSVGFSDIIELMRNAKDEIDYAEILDKTESRLDFLMNDVKNSIEEINLNIDFDKIAKEMEEQRLKALGWEETPSIKSVFEKMARSKER